MKAQKNRIRTTEKTYSTGRTAIELRDIEIDSSDVMTDEEFLAWVHRVTSKVSREEIDNSIEEEAGFEYNPKQ